MDSGIFLEYSGITNNAAEASNARVKRLLDFKERDIDTIVLYFYYFQNIDVNKIFKGFCNMGEFHLRKQYAYASVDPEDITLNNVIHPDSIIDLLRAKLTLEKQSDTGSSRVKNKENQTDENIECADTDAEPKATRSKTIA